MIDVHYDCRMDANGKDPDAASQILKMYNRNLWKRELPSGKIFDLDENLVYDGIPFSSDRMIPTFSKWKRYQNIIELADAQDIERVVSLSWTIGGSIIFPSKPIEGFTINAARGINKKINDRFDLTLECIKRYYDGKDSPLSECLYRYSFYFDLFVDFRGFVDFFFLNDLVDCSYESILFMHPFDEFSGNGLPQSINEYNAYLTKAKVFLENRADRIDQWLNKGGIR